MNKQNHQGDSGTELKLSPDTMHGGYRILAPITCQSITISISHTKRSQVRKKKGNDSDRRRSHPILPIICRSITNGTKCSLSKKKKGGKDSDLRRSHPVVLPIHHQRHQPPQMQPSKKRKRGQEQRPGTLTLCPKILRLETP